MNMIDELRKLSFRALTSTAFLFIALIAVVQSDVMASSKKYFPEDAQKAHLTHISKKYNAEMVCMTPTRKFSDMYIQEMVFGNTEILKRISIFSYRDGAGIIVEESVMPTSMNLKNHSDKVSCKYLK